MSRPRILFVAGQATSFVRDDLALLRERYEVEPFWFDGQRLARSWAAQAATLRRTLPDLVFGWFADYPVWLPVRWAERSGRPAVVVLGGYDAARLPGLNYGVFESRWRAPIARDVCRRASHLVPVAGALLESTNAFAAWPEASAQGVRVHVPRLQTPATVIPTGYDAEAWPLGPDERPPSVLTVAHVFDERTFQLKGLDVLAAAAERLPSIPFTVIGVAPDVAARPLPPNLSLRPPVERTDLAAAYAAASVYVQPSRSEGLPNALCEAMLAGCVPVVSSVGAMPEAVGDLGPVVRQPSGAALADAIGAALDAATGPRRQAVRQRTTARYSRDRRRAELFALLDRLLENEAPGAGP